MTFDVATHQPAPGSRGARPTHQHGPSAASRPDHGAEPSPDEAGAGQGSPTAERNSRTTGVPRDGNFYGMGLLRQGTIESGGPRRRAWWAVGVATTLLLTACGNTVDGSATSSSAPTGTSPTSTSAVAQPNPGNYPTKPRPPLGTADDLLAGSVLDAQRMVGYVTGPWEADPALIDGYPAGPMVLRAPIFLKSFVPVGVVEIAKRHIFINGFASARQVKDQTILRNTVMRFPDPAAATAAATEMNQAALAEPVSGALRSVVSIPGHPDALASNYPFTPAGKNYEWAANAVSFTPHGPYVLMQQAQSTASLDAGLALISKTLDLQGPLIDQFVPTATRDFPTLPLDPSGQLARTLPLPDGTKIDIANATYDRRGELHFMGDPPATAKVFDETGVGVVTTARTNVIQAADAAGAAKIVDEFARQTEASGATPAAPVPGVPDSRCFAIESVGTYCVAAADRYAFEVPAAQPTAVAQMVAAQYLMLTAK